MYKPPPGDLNNRNPLIFVAGQSEPLWYRSHDTDLGAIFFGKTASYRWDAPKGEYGVLYLGGDPFCAFMESIGRGVLRTRFVPQAVLKQRGLSKVALKRPLRLIDMVNAGGLARLGTEASLASGSGYRNSQRWSKALREHPEKPDGIYYRSRHEPGVVACALYEQCEPFVKTTGECVAWADQRELLGAILDRYDFGTDLEF